MSSGSGVFAIVNRALGVVVEHEQHPVVRPRSSDVAQAFDPFRVLVGDRDEQAACRPSASCASVSPSNGACAGRASASAAATPLPGSGSAFTLPTVSRSDARAEHGQEHDDDRDGDRDPEAWSTRAERYRGVTA